MSTCPVTFTEWLDTFLDEKGIELHQFIEIETENAWNLIEVGAVIELMKIAPECEQVAIQHQLIMLDFFNADIMGFLNYLAKAIAR